MMRSDGEVEGNVGEGGGGVGVCSPVSTDNILNLHLYKEQTP